MKKVLIWLLVILLLAAAAVGGFWWYRESHIFVEDAVYAKNSQVLDLRGENISVDHYETVHAQLPDCEIWWSVPFQGSAYSNDITALSVTDLAEEDLTMLKYFAKLETVDASGCQNYDMIEKLMAQYPQLEVRYQVDLGGVKVNPDVTELTLSEGDYDYDVLTENLQHLPGVQSILFTKTGLTIEAVAALAEGHPDIAVDYTVEVLGQEYPSDTSELDLSAMTADDIPEVAAKFAMLENLTSVELMDADGASQLALADVKALKDAAPEVSFNYAFEFYGYTISTGDTEVHIRNKKIGDEGVAEVRQVLDILENCDRFILEYCSISNEVMAQLREDYRDKTKVVWRVVFGKGSCLTDSEVIRTTYNLTGNNCHDLIYCEDARYMDLGHNESLTTVDFVAGMPNLEMIIVSGAPISDLTPFENCKKLKILEIAFCHYVEDISPLAACESLEMLNLGYTQVTDLSPLDEHNMVLLCLDHAKADAAERERFMTLQPDCWVTYGDTQPYGQGWRYDKEDKQLEWYANIADVFGYPEPVNNGGWYLDEE